MTIDPKYGKLAYDAFWASIQETMDTSPMDWNKVAPQFQVAWQAASSKVLAEFQADLLPKLSNFFPCDLT